MQPAALLDEERTANYMLSSKHAQYLPAGKKKRTKKPSFLNHLKILQLVYKLVMGVISLQTLSLL